MGKQNTIITKGCLQPSSSFVKKASNEGITNEKVGSVWEKWATQDHQHGLGVEERDYEQLGSQFL